MTKEHFCKQWTHEVLVQRYSQSDNIHHTTAIELATTVITKYQGQQHIQDINFKLLDCSSF